jgi:hypothetical protein
MSAMPKEARHWQDWQGYIKRSGAKHPHWVAFSRLYRSVHGRRPRMGSLEDCVSFVVWNAGRVSGGLKQPVARAKSTASAKSTGRTGLNIASSGSERPVHCVSRAVRRGRNAGGGLTMDPGAVSRLTQKAPRAV